ncbi:MAG: tRNA lysidine(34) synthetase TilS [Eubacteriales bacterium]
MPFVDRQYAAARAAFLAAAREYGMFDRARGVLVGYSGGADSTLLLRLMRDYCAEHGIYIAAVHVNHRIRGGEAERDAEHCGRTCDTLGVDFRLVTADIPAMARESGRGLEEEARNFRYETFERLLSEDDRLNIAATAHNADDNAETLLFNIARGAGVDGLSGIPPVRAMGQYRVVRPLIYLSKKDIIAACGSIGAEYVTDSTNADTAYTRNYIRHTLVPAFGKLNPSFTDAVQRLTSAARKDAEYLTSLAEGLTRECEVSADRVTIQADKLAERRRRSRRGRLCVCSLSSRNRVVGKTDRRRHEAFGIGG